jgi:uncharacterized protein with FMN-binding domain
MRKFVFCTLASAAVLSIVIIDKAIAAPRPTAGLTATGNTTMGSMAGMRTALGPAVPLAHGLVQVQVTCMGSRIMDVKAVQLPHDNNHSWEDSLHAAAVLRSEVLSKQTTDLHAVSGATYTSEGYLQSLEAALALAAPPAPKMSPTPVT